MASSHFPTFGPLLKSLSERPELQPDDLRQIHGCSITHARNAVFFAKEVPSGLRQLCEDAVLSESAAVDLTRRFGSTVESLAKDALKVAQGKGRGRISPRDFLDVRAQQAQMRLGPMFLGALEQVRSDPAYPALDASVRASVEGALEDLRITRESWAGDPTKRRAKRKQVLRSPSADA